MPSTDVKLDVHYTDRRTLTLNVLNDLSATRDFTRMLFAAANEGYAISNASVIEGGMQRDPYTVGIRIVLERKEPPKPYAPVYRNHDARPRVFA